MKNIVKNFIFVSFIALTIALTVGSAFAHASGSPEAITSGVAGINGTTQNSANLRAYINPRGNNTNTWFDYGTDASLGSRVYGPALIIPSFFTKEITGLTPGTTYYFRACAENAISQGSCGDILSFKTTAAINQGLPPTVYTSTNSNESITVTTKPSSAVTQSTATINGGVTDPIGDSSVSVWFEYGPSVSLGNNTGPQGLGTISTKSFSATLANLEADTIYYFRAVGRNSNGTIKGNILVLKTNPVYVPSYVPSYTQSSVSSPKPSVSNPVSSSVASKFISLKIENKFENVSPGDPIEYEITYKNISSKTIKDAVLMVELPVQVSFERSSKGDSAGNPLIVKIGSLSAGDIGKVVINGKVSGSAKDKDVLLATATVFYSNPVLAAKEKVIAYVVNNVAERNLLPAASIFGNSGFLPDTLIEWLLLTGSIFALIVFGRKFYTDTKTPKV